MISRLLDPIPISTIQGRTKYARLYDVREDIWHLESIRADKKAMREILNAKQTSMLLSHRIINSEGTEINPRNICTLLGDESKNKEIDEAKKKEITEAFSTFKFRDSKEFDRNFFGRMMEKSDCYFRQKYKYLNEAIAAIRYVADLGWIDSLSIESREEDKLHLIKINSGELNAAGFSPDEIKAVFKIFEKKARVLKYIPAGSIDRVNYRLAATNVIADIVNILDIYDDDLPRKEIPDGEDFDFFNIDMAINKAEEEKEILILGGLYCAANRMIGKDIISNISARLDASSNFEDAIAQFKRYQLTFDRGRADDDIAAFLDKFNAYLTKTQKK